MGRAVVHFEIGSRSPETARTFCQKLFGWSITNPVPGMGSFAVLSDPDGNAIGLLRMDAVEGARPGG